eukprot:2275943-Alexandrium_andersonii.AAC.1
MALKAVSRLTHSGALRHQRHIFGAERQGRYDWAVQAVVGGEVEGRTVGRRTRQSCTPLS